MGRRLRQYFQERFNQIPKELRKRDFRLEKIYELYHFDIGDREMDECLEARLEFIADAKSFGVQRLGFEHSLNYRRYREADPRTYYRLYLSPKTVLEDDLKNGIVIEDKAYTELHEDPVTLYSNTRDLLEEKKFYEKQGHDVLHRTVHDFNDGEGCDITVNFLKSPLAQQASTLFHEDWHHSFHEWNPYMRIDRNVNESTANVIGSIAAIAFMEECYGTNSKMHKKAVKRMRKKIKYIEQVNTIFEALQRVYMTSMDEKKKLKKKRKILGKAGYQLNNAQLWEARAYCKNAPLVIAVYESSSSLEHFMLTMQSCPPAEDAALIYLKANVAHNRIKKI
ncbi:aminopeptidase [Thermoproteota archaeon]